MPESTSIVTPSGTRPKRPRAYRKSGIYALKRAVQTLGSRALPPKSTALGRALREWEAALVADLGGRDVISTQQRALVDLAVRTKLLVDSVDAYVLGMESPVNRQKRTLHPVVKERAALVGQLQSLLRDLGLERRARPVESLADYLATRERTREAVPPTSMPAAAPTPPPAATGDPGQGDPSSADGNV